MLPEHVDHIEPVQARHEQVGEHQVDVGLVVLDHPESGLRIGGLHHIANFWLQHTAHEVSDPCFIFDE